MAALRTLSSDGVTITPSLDGATLHLVVSGAVESRDPGAVLDPYWNEADTAARAAGVKRIELDLRPLDFMNSSGILTLVKWISKVKAAPPEGRYEIAIRHDPDVTWQKSNVPVLGKLAPSVVRIAGA